MLYESTERYPHRGVRDFNYFGDPALEVAGTSSRRWKSNGLVADNLPIEGPVYAAVDGIAGEGTIPGPASGGDSFPQRDDDPTVWWKTGDIDDANVAGALLEAADGSIYAGVDQYSEAHSWVGTVFRSVNGGATWEQTGDLPYCRSVTCLTRTGAATLIAGGLAYADGQFYSVIYRSIDGGDSWTIVFSLPNGMVLDVITTAAGEVWASTGWDGAVYGSANDGIDWELAAWFGMGVHVHCLLETSTQRLFAGLGGEAGYKIMWTDDGFTWNHTFGTAVLTEVHDIVESCGGLFAGVHGFGGAEDIYVADLDGISWSSSELPDYDTFMIRALCTSPGCRVFAAGERIGGKSTVSVYEWNAQYDEWFEFGGVIDPIQRVHALLATSDAVYAATGDNYGKIYKHILPPAASVPNPPNQIDNRGFRIRHVNPARDGVELRCSLPQPSPLTVKFYDPTGRLLRTLCHDAMFEVGSHTLIWDGRDEAGLAVPAGMYTYVVHAGESNSIGRVVLIR
ncbi:FlgD immunoglobulin-like domain containing protein [Candidatus Eisenbacteria bacterium]|uniref:FlgD immunoglobulin-like domain containing protein n=1 Tax=Eiseniibacteriota bacterium TaxID=2212470 RepID=A0ABV6YKJ4_UNCEI